MAEWREASDRLTCIIAKHEVEMRWVNASTRWCAALIAVDDTRPLLVYLNERTLPPSLLPAVERWVRRSLLIKPVGVVVLFVGELYYYAPSARQQRGTRRP